MPPPEGLLCYEALFLAASPIHIGWHSLGLIQRTRYFIPSRNIWGATVAALAPLLYPNHGVPEMYTECAKKLSTNLRFTSFFPASPISPAVAMLPDYDPDGGYLVGNKPAEEFEHTFVFSQASAALSPDTLTAETGALHESEYMSPTGRDGSRLSFRGYFFLQPDGIAEDILRTGLANIAVGADRRYGWGRLSLHVPSLRAIDHDAELFGNWRAASDSISKLVVENSRRCPLPAHLNAETANPSTADGNIEVLSGRDWCSTSGSGQRHVAARICWSPGTRVPAGSRFTIDEFGLWTEERQPPPP